MSKHSKVSPSGVLARGVAAFLLVSAQAWADGDPAHGKAKSAMCEGCHGIAGYRTAYPEVYPVPKLGGQQSAYMIKALQDYKSGARTHPSMRGIAATLSEQDIADLAAYYVANSAALVASASAPGHDTGAASKKAEETCAACHGPMGNKPVAPDTPRLAGQPYEYLMHALTAYWEGSRQNPIMSAMAQPLTKEEIRELAWYYSRQQGLVTQY